MLHDWICFFLRHVLSELREIVLVPLGVQVGFLVTQRIDYVREDTREGMCVCVRVCVWQEEKAEKEEDTLRDRKIVCIFFCLYVGHVDRESLWGTNSSNKSLRGRTQNLNNTQSHTYIHKDIHWYTCKQLRIYIHTCIRVYLHVCVMYKHTHQ